MKKNVPAKRYDIFITAYEKYVAEIQERVRKVDRLQKAYEVVREQLELADIENDCKLSVNEYGVSVTITARDGDLEEYFDTITNKIGEALVKASLRDSPTVCKEKSDMWLEQTYRWYLHKLHKPGDSVPYVAFKVFVPSNGTDLIEVTNRKSTYTNTVYDFTWHSQPYKKEENVR